MFNSTVLEVAVGLVFCYAGLALLVSSMTEIIASVLKLRARSLLGGVKDMLNDPQCTGLALAVYNHALVNPRSSGAATDQKGLARNLPSYIASRNFAAAVIEALQPMPGQYAALGARIEQVPDPQMRALLQGMYARSNGQVAQLQTQLANWFDDGMDRVAGGYKRRAQLITFLIALALAGLFGIDSVYLFKSLWVHPSLAASLGAADSKASMDLVLSQMQTLPIGWIDRTIASSTDRSLAAFGVLITASSALFGAPFWFDLLQRVIQLRGSGTRPAKNEPQQQ